MLEKKRIRFIQILCLSTLAACQTGPVQTENLGNTPVSTPVQSMPPVATEVDKSAANSATGSQKADANNIAPPSQPSADPAYQAAINLASSAFTLGQQATSSDDWDLIVGRWEQAIQKLNEVPTDDQNYAVAQTKLKDYQRNLSQAQQRLTNLKQPPSEISLNRPKPISEGTTAAVTVPTRDYHIPIIERRGGTPVIEATFNGRRYPMILDTGASHTHITRTMANELGVHVVGQVSVTTASSSDVAVDVGYVDFLSVGIITRRNLPVSIGDAVPIGLLGNDVYKNFDVILHAHSVEFRSR